MFILNTSFKQLSRNIYQYVRHYKIAPKPILLQLVIQTQRNNFFQTSSEKFDEKTVNVPPLAESVTEGDIRIQKKLGEHVAVDEVIMEIETDKTSVIVPAPGHGIIKEFLVKDGDTVKIGQALFKMDITGKPPEGKQTKLKKEAATPAVLPKPPILSELPKVSVEPDVAVGHRHEQRVKMNRMRLKITERLKEAEMTSVMLTTFNEIDMLEITKFRKETQESFQKKFKIKFGFMSMFLKASAYALLDIPVVNAVIDKKDIIYRDYVDISVAVATPKGLVVPVIKNVENMTFGDIELSLAKLGQMARNNTLAVEDMTGGTFTVSNGGVFGSLMSTPIINPPQSAILGMHGIFDRPVAIKGKVEIRPMMYVALTYDHRLVDGREAVMFLRKIKACVEDPRVILTGL